MARTSTKQEDIKNVSGCLLTQQKKRNGKKKTPPSIQHSIPLNRSYQTIPFLTSNHDSIESCNQNSQIICKKKRQSYRKLLFT